MRNLLFVTVGVSGIRDWIVDDPAEHELRELLKSLKHPEVADFEKARPGLIKWHRNRWASCSSLDDAGLVRHTSAELLTTAKILCQLRDLSPACDISKVILLASKTPDGRFAAEVNREVMESPEYAPVTPKPPVVIESIPAPTGQTVETLSGCILEAVNKHRQSENDRVIFNVTAGFGGVNVLIGMQAVHYGYRLCYEHETMRQPVYIGQNLRAYTSPEPWIIS